MSGDIERIPGRLVILSESIRNYKVTRVSANFMFVEGDKAAFGVVAVAAGVAGLSGQAVSTASSASAEEDADYLEFD